jgi:hypothetical protein
MSNIAALKYQKRNWQKMKCRLYEVGFDENGFGYAIFYKAKNLIRLQCSREKVVQLQQHPLNTVFEIWFTVVSKVAKNSRWYTSANLMHVEKYVPREVQAFQDDRYSKTIQLNSDLFRGE